MIHVVGVRHHSPACARLVEATLRAVRPQTVLIEGPSDFNGRIDELLLAHDLPIALFSFVRAADAERPGVQRASWYPLCSYSPEWVALQVGHELGAEVRFMDLPSWHQAFSDVVNLGADRADRYGDAVELLCRRTGASGLDALWDHLFESETDTTTLAAAFDRYFVEIRGLSPLTPRDAEREAHMADHVAAARARSGDTVIVCGGFHAPTFDIDPEPESAANPAWPSAPTPPEGATAETYLVPFSYHRLDAFTGYQSGMPSPAFYEAVHHDGAQAAAERFFVHAVERIRRARQHISTADLVAARTQIGALAQVRGHRHPLRVDVLDGLASVLLKDAADQAFPWDVRGPLHPRTHPLLVELVAAFSGDRVGRLDPRTPRPPLLADTKATLDALGLTPGNDARVRQLDLTLPVDRRASATLHRLAVLAIPGFVRTDGDGLDITERWRIEPTPDLDVALIEASVHGPTLATASAAKLAAAVADDVGPDIVAGAVLAALQCGLQQLASGAVVAASNAIDHSNDLAALGRALDTLAVVAAADDVLHGTTPQLRIDLVELVATTLRRFLWLLESLTGPSSPEDEGVVAGLVALCRAVRRTGAADDLVKGVLERRAIDRSAPPAVRGGCLGSLWHLQLLDDVAEGAEVAVAALRSLPPDQQPGDFLDGLFATAGSLTVTDDRLLAALDELVESWTPDQFLTLLPALRRSFRWFPPRDRARIGDRIAALRGLSPSTRLSARLSVDPMEVAAGAALDARIEELVDRYGLDRSAT